MEMYLIVLILTYSIYENGDRIRLKRSHYFTPVRNTTVNHYHWLTCDYVLVTIFALNTVCNIVHYACHHSYQCCCHLVFLSIFYKICLLFPASYLSDFFLYSPRLPSFCDIGIFWAQVAQGSALLPHTLRTGSLCHGCHFLTVSSWGFLWLLQCPPANSPKTCRGSVSGYM